MILSNQIRQLR